MNNEEWSFSINIRELNVVCELLLQYLREVAGDSVQLHEDYYWNIPKESIYQFDEAPTDLDIGQLTDDWNVLRKYLDGEEYGPIPYSFVWLAAIFRAIGESRMLDLS